MKVIGVVGSRRRNDKRDFDVVFNTLMEMYEDGDWLCSGGCPKGADSFALQIAKGYGWPILIFWPNWSSGRAAGFVRNTQIAKVSTVLIACVASDRTGGTEDTIKKFRKLHSDSQLIILEE